MNLLHKLFHIEPEIIEVPKYIQVKRWSNEIDGILADIQWEKDVITSRIENPELYQDNENVTEVISKAQAFINNLQARLLNAL